MEAPLPLRRDLHFKLDPARVQDWHGRGPHVSQFFNTLSLYFPEGEKFFIQSVRHYRDRVADPRQQEAVTAFIGQEAMHGREHREYNQMLQDSGLPANAIEEFSLNRLKMLQKLAPPRFHLAVTMALEHLTAIMAAHMLRTPAVLADSDPGYQRLWRWHALEETEHKAVAFEVWQAVSDNNLRSYLLRCYALLQSSFFFWLFTAIHWTRMCRAAAPKGEGHVRGTLRLLRFLFIHPAAWLALAPAWFAYFKPGFHPWQHDNRAALVELESYTPEASS